MSRHTLLNLRYWLRAELSCYIRTQCGRVGQCMEEYRVRLRRILALVERRLVRTVR